MRIFISYKYTGVSLTVLNNTVGPLIRCLRECGHTVFCNLELDDDYVREQWNTKQIMMNCFDQLNESNYHITFVAPNNIMGEGMLIELGYAIKLNIPTLLLMPNNFDSISAKAVVDTVIEYSSIDDLLYKLRELF